MRDANEGRVPRMKYFGHLLIVPIERLPAPEFPSWPGEAKLSRNFLHDPSVPPTRYLSLILKAIVQDRRSRKPAQQKRTLFGLGFERSRLNPCKKERLYGEHEVMDVHRASMSILPFPVPVESSYLLAPSLS